MTGSTAAVFVWMLREEWRLHARLFGGPRFAAFPAFVALVSGASAWFLVETGTTAASVVAGVHALVFAFGLHTGSIGFVGRDAARNLLGGVTLLVFSGRTLPLSPRRLVAVFLANDLVYYTGLFLVPLSLGLVPAAGLAFLPRLPLVWLSMTGTFLLGVSATFALIALSTRSHRVLVLVVAAALVLGAWLVGIDLVGLTPYGFYRAPGLASGLRAALPILVLVAVGLTAYDSTYRRPSRTAPNRFGPWRRRLADETGIVTKSLLDVARSSGSLWKVLFSGGVLFAVIAFLIRTIEPVIGVVPSAGVSFGALLGLTAFTTYNWLTQFDELEPYLVFPVDAAAVFRAKYRAFAVLGVPTVLAYHVVAIVLFDARPGEAIVGGVLALGVLSYLFGLTVYLAGFEPNEFLFDTLLFAAFSAAVSLALVPVLVVGFVLAPLSPTLLGGLVVAGLLFGAAGTLLYGRAIPRWEARYRRGIAE